MDARAATFSTEGLKRFDTFLSGYAASGRLAGITALLWQGGREVYFGAHGYQDLESKTPMARDTVFGIYSMTKPITSVAAMMLWEEGKFDLDDPIAKYLPEFEHMEVYVGGEGESLKTEPAKSPITIRQLLSHSSGLIHPGSEKTVLKQMYADEKLAGGRSAGTTEDIVKRVARLPLGFHPGTQWRYSMATDVMGRFIEVVTGQLLSTFFKERIFNPLGMNETGFQLPESLVPRFAGTYGPGENGQLKCLDAPKTNRYLKEPEHRSGGGGLVSTADDYLRFAKCLHNGGVLDGVQIIKPETLKLMTANQLNGDIAQNGAADFNQSKWDGIGFGLGFSVVTDPSVSEYGNLGAYSWSGAASTLFWIDPSIDLIAMQFAQFMPSTTYPLRKEFRAAVYDALAYK